MHFKSILYIKISCRYFEINKQSHVPTTTNEFGLIFWSPNPHEPGAEVYRKKNSKKGIISKIILNVLSHFITTFCMKITANIKRINNFMKFASVLSKEKFNIK